MGVDNDQSRRGSVDDLYMERVRGPAPAFARDPIPASQAPAQAAPAASALTPQQIYTQTLEREWVSAGRDQPGISGERMVVERTCSVLKLYTGANFFQRTLNRIGRNHIDEVTPVIDDLNQPPVANQDPSLANNGPRSYQALRRLQQIRLVNQQGALATTIEFLKNKIAVPVVADDDVPSGFLCPITLSIMPDPVVDEFNHSYSGAALQQARRNANRSPKTNQPYTTPANVEFRPNYALKEVIDDYLRKKQQSRPSNPSNS